MASDRQGRGPTSEHARAYAKADLPGKANAPLCKAAVKTKGAQKAHDKHHYLDDRELFRYFGFERVPGREGECGAFGQVIGDDWPPDTNSTAVISLAPAQSLSRTLDIAPQLATALSEPGDYKISLEYCNQDKRRERRAKHRWRCVVSIEIALRIVAD